MKKVSWKMLKTIYILLGIFALFLMFGTMWMPMIVFSFFPLAVAVLLMIKNCRCPYCNTWENMDRLTYARSHIYHCRGCGQIIEIDTKN